MRYYCGTSNWLFPKLKNNSCFIYGWKRLTIVVHFEGRWFGGTRVSPLVPALRPQRTKKGAMSPSSAFYSCLHDAKYVTLKYLLHEISVAAITGGVVFFQWLVLRAKRRTTCHMVRTNIPIFPTEPRPMQRRARMGPTCATTRT